MTMPTADLDVAGYEGLRLGLCQIETAPWDVDGNLARTLDALGRAADQGAELAITPENVIQGYPGQASEEEKRRLREIAEPVDGPRLRAVRDLARARRMDVVIGFAEAAAGGLIHNSCVYIDGGGEVRAVYRKVHCRPFESIEHDGIYTSGETFVTAPFGRDSRRFHVGLMICFDREIPESARCLRAMGAEFIACPLATNTSDMVALPDKADNEMLTRARAAENEVFIAVVNHAKNYNGGTFVVGPSGELLVQLGAVAEVRCLQVPVGIVRQKFHCDPLGWAGWGYRRPNVYRKHFPAG